MQITAQTIITAASVLSAFGAILTLIFKVYKWYLKQGEQDRKIKSIEEENTLLCFGISASLDGLIQLGANHSVPKAKDTLDKYLNQKAHNRTGGEANEKH